MLVRGTPVHFRGRANLAATLATLIEQYGMGDAEEVILSGGSAGGVATYQSLDWAGGVLRRSCARLRSIVGFADTGLFLDGATLGLDWGSHWAVVDELWGSTASGNSVAGCLAEQRAAPWKCLLSQHALPHIETKFYAMNSDVDMWCEHSIA